MRVTHSTTAPHCNTLQHTGAHCNTDTQLERPVRVAHSLTDEEEAYVMMSKTYVCVRECLLVCV